MIDADEIERLEDEHDVAEAERILAEGGDAIDWEDAKKELDKQAKNL